MVAEPGEDDRHLVAAVRRGDDRAFEALYSRYHRRIHAYVMGMVKDHGRAEDVTQEVFVSAFRRMRETERPIAFKPWIYEIAKNACIDQFRRSRRTEEVSLQADEGLAPADYGKLVGSDPTPDAAVAAKQDLDNLCGAFGGLSETHHEILVLRELEGLSYREIGDRMGMSRPAVESTLFRARRRLTEEYDDLVSGARCQRIQELIQSALSSRLGTREQRRLSRHVAHCQPCRREAMAAGLDSAILTHVPLPKRAAAKIAGLLPFPIFGRGRGGDSGWSAHIPLLSDQAGGWGKLATTAAAVLVAGVGAAGMGTHVAGSEDREPARERPAQEPSAPAAAKPAGMQIGQPAGGSAAQDRAERAAERPRRSNRASARGDRRAARDPRGSTGAGADRPAATSGGGGGAAGNARGGGRGSGLSLPAAGQDPVGPVQETVKGVGETVGGTVGAVGETVDDTVGAVGETVDGTAGAVGETVESVGQTVPPVVEGVQDTVEGATAPVPATVGKVGKTLEDTTGAVQNATGAGTALP